MTNRRVREEKPSRKLIKTANIDVEEQTYSVRYCETETLRGHARYSAEVILGPGDRIILDDDAVNSLELKIACVLPATVYSRMLAAKTSVHA